MLAPLPASRWNYATAAHLLNRAGFGGTPADVQNLVQLGPEKAVARFVDYDEATDDMANPDWAHPDPERLAKLLEMRRGNVNDEKRREAQREYQMEQRQHILDLRHWWLRKMAKGSRPLQEKLTLFWHGHFATSTQKVKDAYLMWRQNDLFRRHAAGSWLKMLEEVSKDPAMLIWLDQAQSRREKPNENYAREVMELFTLGEGHYTETDILEAARAFTGWTLNRMTQEFFDAPRQHDNGPKTFLGRTGNLDGMDVLRQIVAQPQAAIFISEKLWRFFASDNPPPKTIEALAAVFRDSDNHFKPLLATLFRCEEFYAADVVGNQVKSPVQWLVGSVRALERELPPPQVSSFLLAGLGQDLFAPPNVKGWDGGLAWITTNNLLNRYNEAAVLIDGQRFGEMAAGPRGRIPPPMMQRPFGPRGVGADLNKFLSAEEKKDKKTLLAALEKRFLQIKLKPAQEKTLREYLDAQPELNDATIRHAIRLIMATPEFQLT